MNFCACCGTTVSGNWSHPSQRQCDGDGDDGNWHVVRRGYALEGEREMPFEPFDSGDEFRKGALQQLAGLKVWYRSCLLCVKGFTTGIFVFLTLLLLTTWRALFVQAHDVEVLHFSPSLNNKQRRFLHVNAAEMGLKSHSQVSFLPSFLDIPSFLP
jgi:hypothetical protein